MPTTTAEMPTTTVERRQRPYPGRHSRSRLSSSRKETRAVQLASQGSRTVAGRPRNARSAEGCRARRCEPAIVRSQGCARRDALNARPSDAGSTAPAVAPAAQLEVSSRTGSAAHSRRTGRHPHARDDAGREPGRAGTDAAQPVRRDASASPHAASASGGNAWRTRHRPAGAQEPASLGYDTCGTGRAPHDDHGKRPVIPPSLRLCR